MRTQARWIFVLVGNDGTGKTTFQKCLIRILTEENRDVRLDCNLRFDITHDNFPRKIRTLFIANRSLQEKMPDDYKSVDDYFDNHFKQADVCLISSHLVEEDIAKIVQRCHRLFYNACAVFFSNSVGAHANENTLISELNWDDRWQIENPLIDEDEEARVRQIDAAARSFVQMLIERTRGW